MGHTGVVVGAEQTDATQQKNRGHRATFSYLSPSKFMGESEAHNNGKITKLLCISFNVICISIAKYYYYFGNLHFLSDKF